MRGDRTNAAAQLAREGKNAREIAAATGMHVCSVYEACKARGVRVPKPMAPAAGSLRVTPSVSGNGVRWAARIGPSLLACAGLLGVRELAYRVEGGKIILGRKKGEEA